MPLEFPDGCGLTAQGRLDVERAHADHLAREAAADHREREIADLRARVAQLEGTIARLPKSIGRALGATRREIMAQVLKFCGVYSHGTSYEPNAVVVRSGSLWVATQKTNEVPGRHPSWTLIVKQGDPPKDPALR